MVTGASRGLGLAFVRTLLGRSGVTRIFAACRNPEAARDLSSLARENPHRLFVLRLDVEDEASIALAAQQVRKAVPRLNLLLNTIGALHDSQGLSPERKLESVTLENLRRSFAVNAFGPILLAKHFGPLLMHTERAVFASLSARVGSIGDNRLGGWYAYRASKAAQNQFVHTLAIEMRRRAPNLICVLLHPGTVDTELSAPFQSGVAQEKLFKADDSCAMLLGVIDRLESEQSGRFFAWDGTEIPW